MSPPRAASNAVVSRSIRAALPRMAILAIPSPPAASGGLNEAPGSTNSLVTTSSVMPVPVSSTRMVRLAESTSTLTRPAPPGTPRIESTAFWIISFTVIWPRSPEYSVLPMTRTRRGSKAAPALISPPGPSARIRDTNS